MTAVTDISTIKSGRKYRATIGGVRYGLMLTDTDSVPMVALYPPTGRAGLYRLDRFDGGVLSPASIRALFGGADG